MHHHGKPDYTFDVRIVQARDDNDIIEYTADFTIYDAAGEQVKFVKGTRVYAYYESAEDEACSEATTMIASFRAAVNQKGAAPKDAN